MNFETSFERIKQKTNLKNMMQLAEFIGCSQQNVSAKKKNNIFPIEWAFKIAQRYNLSTDWIMTGEVPLNENLNQSDKFVFLNGIKLWLDSISEQDEAAIDWFKYEFNRNFPEFREWLKHKGIIK